MRAILSVWDKEGIADFAAGLHGLGVELFSTGNTQAAIAAAGVPVKSISELTGFPEILDGRVKTLHPAVHGGLLARRDRPEHLEAARAHGITPIDLIAVNLYPFRETAGRAGVRAEDVIEQIDIGGPSMLRSAAKNFASVTAVVDPADYPRVLDALRAADDDLDLRRLLAGKVFAHTAAYDAAIAGWFAEQRDDDALPAMLALTLDRAQTL